MSSSEHEFVFCFVSHDFFSNKILAHVDIRAWTRFPTSALNIKYFSKTI